MLAAYELQKIKWQQIDRLDLKLYVIMKTTFNY